MNSSDSLWNTSRPTILDSVVEDSSINNISKTINNTQLSNSEQSFSSEKDETTLRNNWGNTNGTLSSLSVEINMLKKACSNIKIHDVDDEDESVIPVDDDDVSGGSMLVSPAIVESKEIMFSHLQPKNASVDMVFDNEEIHIENGNGECISEENFPLDEKGLFQNSLVEVARRMWPSTMEKQHFTKGCLWSPDGTCLLVPVHLDGMHVIELPTDLYTIQSLPANRTLTDLTSAVHVKEGGTVYDFCWYPYMNSSDPATCCWLATRQHEPIHMWDAFSGELRCSYRGYDDVDEVESAISVIFSNDAQKVIGGFKKTIKVFNTNIPGRDCTSIRVKKPVSCFSLTTDNDNCVTAGTWAGYINHYDLRAPKLGSLFTLGGHTGGITYLKYAPTVDKSWYLFSGARKDNKILQWDMRNYTAPVKEYERTVQTNQRIYYDLTPFNSWLASGDTEGFLRIWGLENNDLYELHLHQDCCNGVSFHPSLPIIATSSGQYHFEDVTELDVNSTEKIVNYENAVLMLWHGPSENY